MKFVRDHGLFARELSGWAWRGILCALPSACWAAIADFNQPVEFAAMAAGTTAWIAVFAWLSSSEAMQANDGRARLVRALKMAAGLKAASLIGVAIAWGLVAGLKTPGGLWLAVGLVPDIWTGLGSVWLVGQPAGVGESMNLGQLNSFGWTLATTLVQGALISTQLGLLALGVLGWWRVWPWLRGFSPARIPG